MKTIKDFFRSVLSEDIILWTHKVRAMFAVFIYGNPSKKLKVIGVTGTNGKTTTCVMISKILEEAGYKVGLATTIYYKIDKKEWVNKSKMTTISPFKLQKLLKEMVESGCKYAIIETTSHAIKQYRNYGIKYEAVVLTNLTHDHLDYHKTFSDYRDTKTRLFEGNPNVSVINRDDPNYAYFAKKSTRNLYLYGIDEKADVVAKKIILEAKGSTFTLIAPEGQTTIELNIPGKFNIYNALGALSVALSQKISFENIKNALKDITGVPGRMEKIDFGQDYAIIVDFAHTPDGLQKVFETIESFKKGKIIHVGGATGRRDKTKRPILGALAGKYADIVIVTDEDPYDEDPAKIIDEVAAGVERGAMPDNPKEINKNFFKILDRKDAIKFALSIAKKDDIVLITGKGGEEVMAVGNELIPYSDKNVVKDIFGGK